MSISYPKTIAKCKADAALTQANPVVDTWYTILDTTLNVRIYCIAVKVTTTGETLQCRLTIDGNVWWDQDITGTADTVYYEYKDNDPSNASNLVESTAIVCPSGKYTFLEGRSVKVEVRKTTENGTGNLMGRVQYGVIEQ